MHSSTKFKEFTNHGCHLSERNKRDYDSMLIIYPMIKQESILVCLQCGCVFSIQGIEHEARCPVCKVRISIGHKDSKPNNFETLDNG
jgi:predicted Zn-ribbon and HTH transcriptional regulator